MAAESAPVPKKRRLSLSLRKRLSRLAQDLVQLVAIAQVITWLRQTIVYIAHSSLLPQYYNFHHSSIIYTTQLATIWHLWKGGGACAFDTPAVSTYTCVHLILTYAIVYIQYIQPSHTPLSPWTTGYLNISDLSPTPSCLISCIA